MINKHIVAGIYSATQPNLQQEENEVLTKIPLANERGQLVQSVSRIVSELTKMGIHPTEVGLDLL